MRKLIKTTGILALAALVSACNPVGTAVGAATSVATGVATTAATTTVGLIL